MLPNGWKRNWARSAKVSLPRPCHTERKSNRFRLANQLSRWAWMALTSMRGGRAGWFEVIVGKSVSAAGDGKYFGFVHNIDDKPKRRLYEVLRSQGLEPDQPVQFLSDGEETVRNLQMYISPQSEHRLDWFHITMRLTVMGQIRKGLKGVESASLAEQAK